MSNVIGKIAYKPVGMALGAAAGAISSSVFKRVWRRVGSDPAAPKANDEQRTWRDVLLAAGLQGAIFAVVRATIDRAGATGMRKATGYWPA